MSSDQLPVTPHLIFGAKRKWKPFKRDKSTSRDFVARSAASRPTQRPLCGLKTYSTLKFMRSTCGKSNYCSAIVSSKKNPPGYPMTQMPHCHYILDLTWVWIWVGQAISSFLGERKVDSYIIILNICLYDDADNKPTLDNVEECMQTWNILD